jgi:voltage-gated potassium channel
MKKNKTILYIIIALVIYFFAVTVVYLVESNKSDSNIKSFSDAVWYSIITLTTIGYGDKFPVTGLGKIVALIFVFGSVGILGFVISQISNKIIKIMEDKKLGYNGTKFQNHVVIINWNPFAMQILSEIVNANQKAVVVTKNKNDVDYIYNNFDDNNTFVLYSDFFDTSILAKTNIEKSATVLLNFEDDTENLVQLISIKANYPNLNYVISLNNPSLKSTFQSLGVTFTLSKNEVAAKLVASYVFEPQVAAITEGFMSSATNDDDLGMMQYKVVPENDYLNFKCLDLYIELKKQFNMILVGISKFDGKKHVLHRNPGNEISVGINDYLVVLGTKISKEKIFSKFKVEEGI